MQREFGPFHLVRQLAAGGMAELYLAKSKGLAGFERYVALKMLHPSFGQRARFVQMLIDEAKLAAQLAHRNIAQTYDLGTVGDRIYITMEYVDGIDLFDLLRGIPDLPFELGVFIAKEIANALAHAHDKRDRSGKPLGIVHRDVSPQNIMISKTGDVKLIDFGIAKARTTEWPISDGILLGKYCYMSPEQASGHPIDHRSDIFSTGIVLYEVLAQRMMYRETARKELIAEARRADITPLTTVRPEVPPPLGRIVMRALAKSPDDRYQSAGELAAELERYLMRSSEGFYPEMLAALVDRVAEATTLEKPPDREAAPATLVDPPRTQVGQGTPEQAMRPPAPPPPLPHTVEITTTPSHPVAIVAPEPTPVPEPAPEPAQPSFERPHVPPQAYFQQIMPRAFSAAFQNLPAHEDQPKRNRWLFAALVTAFVLAAAGTYVIASARDPDVVLAR